MRGPLPTLHEFTKVRYEVTVASPEGGERSSLDLRSHSSPSTAVPPCATACRR